MYTNFREIERYWLLVVITGLVLSSCEIPPTPVENEKKQPVIQATVGSITATPQIDTSNNELARESQVQIILTLTPTGPDKQNDRLTVDLTGPTAIIDVVSPTGIGAAEITAATGHWPQRLIFRLHLRALEGFEISKGDQYFSYALDPDENVDRYNHSKAGQKLDPIEVEIPPSMLKGSPNSFNIQWVDWYR